VTLHSLFVQQFSIARQIKAVCLEICPAITQGNSLEDSGHKAIAFAPASFYKLRTTLIGNLKYVI